MKASPPDIAILEYGDPTDIQREQIKAWVKYGTSRKAAKVLGCGHQQITRAGRTVAKRAALNGYAQHFNATRFVPPGESVKGRSVYTTDDEGNKVWLKTEKDKATEENNLRELVEELAKGIKPFKLVPIPQDNIDDLATVYTITDYHIGAYSWKDETGADWDVEIAEKTLMTGVGNMVKQSPKSSQAIFCQMGDFLHFDSLEAVTPQNKNILDSDSRYPLLVRIAIRCCLLSVELLLRKHENVHVIMCEGNHDLAGSVWLQVLMDIAFKDNPRVTIDRSAFPYYSFVWGEVFMGWHHGHLTKIKQMASKFYSETRFRKQMAFAKYIYLHTGHLHTKEVIEESGAVIERHPTLSARDAYGARGFDQSQRGAIAVTYHKERGEVSRVTVVP